MPEQKPVTFEIVAADSAAEIYLIDGDFRLVKKGVGRETFTVPPGVYKIKNRSGLTTTERLIVVRDGLTTVKLDPVRIGSAMPLLHSAKTHEYHMSAAQGAASAPDLSRGSGSNIVIVARQWTGQAPRASQTSPPNPARGLTLLDSAGAVVADVAALTKVVGTLDPIVALNVELTPGPYRLSLTRADGCRVAQTLIASPGWQTIVYLLVDGSAEDEAARVDLVNGAITLQKPGQGFDATDSSLRAQEIARGALRDSHWILSDEMRAQFTSAAAPPVLALIGAHLLIREANDERERLAREPGGDSTVADGNRTALRTIVENLRAAIGRHPDVEAVATVAGNPGPDFNFGVPPMLRASWPLLLDVSVNRPAAIPADSLTAHAAERIWGEGSWLQWLEAGPHETVDRAALWQAKGRELLASFAGPSGVESAGAGEPAMAPMATVAATAVVTSQPIVIAAAEKLLLKVQQYLRRTRTPFPTQAEIGVTRTEQPVSIDLRQASALLTGEHREQLVKQLGVPLSRINAWLEQVDK